MNSELPDVHAGIIKGRGSREQIANIHWIIEKAREFQKNIYFYFTDCAKIFDVCITTNCGKFWKRWNTRPPDLPPEKSVQRSRSEVRIGYGTTDCVRIGKGVRQGCIVLSCLFNLYAEYIMRNTGLDESQAGFKIAGRNISNLRYADDTPLWQKAKRN